MSVRETLVEIIQNSVGGCARNWAEIIADGLIANGVTFKDVPDTNVGEWISVDTQMPPYNTMVLIYRPTMAETIITDTYFGFYGEDDDEWYEGWTCYGKDIHGRNVVTHWMSLPQPPKGE